MDVALEVRILRDLLRLLEQGLVAANLDDAPLVEGQRAEAARAEAAAAARQAELDLLDGRDAAGRLVIGVIGAGVRQRVDRIHLLGRKRHLRRVLHEEEVVRRVGLDERFRRERVGVAVLPVEAFGVQLLARRHLVEARQADGVRRVGRHGGFVYRAADKGDVPHRDTAAERLGDFHNRPLAHAVGDQVCAGVEQNGALHVVRPVVVVREAAQTGLDAAEDDRCFLVGAADQVGVDDRGVIRPQPHFPARRVGVHTAALFGNRVVVDHRIHIAGGDEEAELRLAERGDARGVAPVRLGDDADRKAVGLEHAGDDRGAEGGVVDVGVAADVDEIELFDAAGGHICFGDGEKSASVHIVFPTLL